MTLSMVALIFKLNLLARIHLMEKSVAATESGNVDRLARWAAVIAGLSLKLQHLRSCRNKSAWKRPPILDVAQMELPETHLPFALSKVSKDRVEHELSKD